MERDLLATKPIQTNRAARRHPETNAQRRWASLKHAADYLGVTDRTIRQMITDGKFRGYRLNQRLYASI